MAIRAVIFDIGGVLIDVDWDTYRKCEQAGVAASDIFRSYEQLNIELAQFVGSLHPRYKVATICNGGSCEALNRKFRLSELVDLMLFDGEEGISKPDARIYQRALTRLGVQPHEAIFVDDKQCNVEAAQCPGDVCCLLQKHRAGYC
ncbi:MAG TPA: HAD-IA family hydrolase [Ktedonobacteraceae bacterium]|nr:HAD-IA family hydrolase [Ktedonobacteraceae bacterium]